jgi:hypothetical protein
MPTEQSASRSPNQTLQRPLCYEDAAVRSLSMCTIGRYVAALYTTPLGINSSSILAGQAHRNPLATFVVEITDPGDAVSSWLLGFNERIIALYVQEMTVQDIRSHLDEIYRADVSARRPRPAWRSRWP